MWFITAKRTYLIILGIYSDGLQFRNFFIFLCTCYLVSSADDQNLTHSPRFWEKERIVGKDYVEFTWRERYRDSCPLFRGSQPWLLFSCAAATNAQTWRRKQDAYCLWNEWATQEFVTFSSEKRRQQATSAWSTAWCSPGASCTCCTWISTMKLSL